MSACEVEVWAKTHNPRYSVSTLGNVRRSDTDRVLRPVVNPVSGYGMVQLYDGAGNATFHYVHRLVAHAFVPGSSDKPHVNHKNMDRMDNRAANLEWVTPAENNAHARANKPPQYATGAAVYTTKLTPREVREIRERSGNQSLRSLGREYGVGHQTIRALVNRKTWKEVG